MVTGGDDILGRYPDSGTCDEYFYEFVNNLMEYSSSSVAIWNNVLKVAQGWDITWP